MHLCLQFSDITHNMTIIPPRTCFVNSLMYSATCLIRHKRDEGNMSDCAGCRNIQVLDCTKSPAYIQIYAMYTWLSKSISLQNIYKYNK